MNYLAHLYFAKPTADSHMGNLLGDFRKGAQLSRYSESILAGLGNHYLVDKFTDAHAKVRQAKQLFNIKHRRFSGIALDVLFDHFIIKNWALYARYEEEAFEQFKNESYQFLLTNQSIMPKRMNLVVGNMTKDDWFEQYRDIEGIARALTNIAKRIRFANNFQHCVDDIYCHYESLEDIFHQFFPELQEHVGLYSPETLIA